MARRVFSVGLYLVLNQYNHKETGKLMDFSEPMKQS